jgi:cell division protein FtsB
MKQVSGEQVGSALRRLAEDLVAERRRAIRLERENTELKAEVETLRRVVAESECGSSEPRSTRGPFTAA